MKYNNMERQHNTLQSTEARQREEIEELKARAAVLERERQVLADGEAQEKATSEQHDHQWAEERVSSSCSPVVRFVFEVAADMSATPESGAGRIAD